MTEYVNVRASETLDQGELVAFLKSRFAAAMRPVGRTTDRKSTRLNSSHGYISYAVFCLKTQKSPLASNEFYLALTSRPRLRAHIPRRVPPCIALQSSARRNVATCSRQQRRLRSLSCASP